MLHQINLAMVSPLGKDLPFDGIVLLFALPRFVVEGHLMVSKPCLNSMVVSPT